MPRSPIPALEPASARTSGRVGTPPVAIWRSGLRQVPTERIAKNTTPSATPIHPIGKTTAVPAAGAATAAATVARPKRGSRPSRVRPRTPSAMNHAATAASAPPANADSMAHAVAGPAAPTEYTPGPVTSMSESAALKPRTHAYCASEASAQAGHARASTHRARPAVTRPRARTRATTPVSTRTAVTPKSTAIRASQKRSVRPRTTSAIVIDFGTAVSAIPASASRLASRVSSRLPRPFTMAAKLSLRDGWVLPSCSDCSRSVSRKTAPWASRQALGYHRSSRT